jgi:hypothetical protein
MNDMRAQLEKLRETAAECALIGDLATDRTKRELFSKLAEHFRVLASVVESALAANSRVEGLPSAPNRQQRSKPECSVRKTCGLVLDRTSTT